MKFRITVRSDNIELRGYVSGTEDECNSCLADLNAFATDIEAMVVYSPAPDEYNPFSIEDHL